MVPRRFTLVPSCHGGRHGCATRMCHGGRCFRNCFVISLPQCPAKHVSMPRGSSTTERGTLQCLSCCARASLACSAERTSRPGHSSPRQTGSLRPLHSSMTRERLPLLVVVGNVPDYTGRAIGRAAGGGYGPQGDEQREIICVHRFPGRCCGCGTGSTTRCQAPTAGPPRRSAGRAHADDHPPARRPPGNADLRSGSGSAALEHAAVWARTSEAGEGGRQEEESCSLTDSKKGVGSKALIRRYARGVEVIPHAVAEARCAIDAPSRHRRED